MWLCKICDRNGTATKSGSAGLFNIKATTNASYHLEKKHQITKESPYNTSEASESTASIPSEATASGHRTISSMFAAATASKITPIAKVTAFRDTLVDWITKNAIPFNIIAHEDFQALMLMPHDAIIKGLPLSAITVRTLIQ
jgi:hypothetical protein